MKRITETVREYDEMGNVTREVVTETTEELPTAYIPTAWTGTATAEFGSVTCATSTPENSTPTKKNQHA